MIKQEAKLTLYKKTANYLLLSATLKCHTHYFYSKKEPQLPFSLTLGSVDLSRLNFVRDKSVLIAASSA